jgi:hypothetical protein
MSAIGAAWGRLVGIGRIPDCERCGEPMVIVSDQRVAMVPPVFDVKCQCSGCGAFTRVRQALAHFE